MTVGKASFACLMLVVAVEAQQVGPSPGRDFDERFLIAIPHRDVPPEREPAPPARWVIDPLFDGQQVTESAQESSEKDWLVVRRQKGESPFEKSTAPDAEEESPWDQAHGIVDGKDPELSAYLQNRGGGAPLEVEPNVIFYDAIEVVAAIPSDCGSPVAGYLTICSPSSPVWPSPPRFAWHLGNEFSQLGAARARAEAAFADQANRVTIVHLDTGYNPANDSFRPVNLDLARSRSFLAAETTAEDPYHEGLLQFPGHGSGTLSILAGGRVHVQSPQLGEFNDYYGGAPLAHVIVYRIGNSVIHVWPTDMTRAIHSAWAVDHADVISMSMGSTPSAALRDEVNAAYDHGTAMVFAAGDFVQFGLLLRTPHTTVYPARFSRTIAVTGATAEWKSYGRNPSLRWLLSRRYRSSWRSRGSWGPKAVMAHSLAAFTPNVPRNRMTKNHASDLVDLDFSGTSAATPQVAAATALWLQMHRPEFSDREWRSWKKSEAAYQALFETARKDKPSTAYSEEYFGRGVLQASDALGFNRSPKIARQPTAEIGVDWLRILGSLIHLTSKVAATKSLHERMLRTEIEQLVMSNRHLATAALTVAGSEENSKELKNFVNEIRSDSRASKFLRASLSQE